MKEVVANPYQWLTNSLETIRQANWYRSPQTIDSFPGTTINLKGHSLINFASNDYLGLAGDRRLIEAAIAATEKYGTGSTGSRLLSGDRPLHQELEQSLANLKQTEAAIAALKIVREEPQRRQQLWQNVEGLKQQLACWEILPSNYGFVVGL